MIIDKTIKNIKKYFKTLEGTLTGKISINNFIRSIKVYIDFIRSIKVHILMYIYTHWLY